MAGNSKKNGRKPTIERFYRAETWIDVGTTHERAFDDFWENLRLSISAVNLELESNYDEGPILGSRKIITVSGKNKKVVQKAIKVVEDRIQEFILYYKEEEAHPTDYPSKYPIY